MGLFEILKGEQPGLIKSLLHYKNVGQYGEYLTEYALLSRSMEGYYAVLKNLYLPMKGKTTEIDLLMIHEKGIFVFESKNYSGWIFGSEDQLKWTQCFKSGQREHFYNPIKQNEGHVRFLRHLLKCSVDIPLIPIVVFNNSAELKVHVSNHIVVNRCNLNWAISQYHDIILNATQVDWIVNTIQRYYTIADKEEIRQHKHNVHDRQYRAKSLIRQGVCPQCGGQLVLRKGRYGSFYGCSNYPKCKFTINK